MKKVAKISTIAAISLVLNGLIGVFVPSFAQSVQEGVEAAHGEGVPTSILGDGGVMTTIINGMLFVIGFLSVVMLIWGGLRYVVSGGNSNSVTAAKNTILYAIVGLVIAIFAYAIVNFVIGSITGGSFTGGTDV